MKVDFATFCYAGDAHRLHAPGQLKRQVESNDFEFNRIIVIYQGLINYSSFGYRNAYFQDFDNDNMKFRTITNIDNILTSFDIDLDRPQYISEVDNVHYWKNHVVNHLAAIQWSNSDYIVFADNDCWMIRQPEDESWIEMGIWILDNNPAAFIVSPNDGEPERRTKRFSQQMFLARVDEFRNADFNQPGWDGNVNIPGGPMPEYWAMLEGRMELHCRVTEQHRYVLGSEYRYWHFNQLTEDGFFEGDYERY